MAAKEKLMSVLGGRLLLEEPHVQAETATSARLRYSAEAASLRTISGAVSAALTRVLRWHVWWQGTGELPLDVHVRLTDEFFMHATADEVRAATSSMQAELISYKTFYQILQRGGWTRKEITADEELREIRREPGSPRLVSDTGAA